MSKKAQRYKRRTEQLRKQLARYKQRPLPLAQVIELEIHLPDGAKLVLNRVVFETAETDHQLPARTVKKLTARAHYPIERTMP